MIKRKPGRVSRKEYYRRLNEPNNWPWWKLLLNFFPTFRIKRYFNNLEAAYFANRTSREEILDRKRDIRLAMRYYLSLMSFYQYIGTKVVEGSITPAQAYDMFQKGYDPNAPEPSSFIAYLDLPSIYHYQELLKSYGIDPKQFLVSNLDVKNFDGQTLMSW